MHQNEEPHQNLSGSLLVAHPSLVDPNFVKSVVLLSMHSEEEGAVGVIVNRPVGKKLGEIDDNYSNGPLADVPIYLGGPVSPDQMILSAWQCESETGVFKLYFGLTEDKLKEIKEQEPELEIRAFLGYAGWSGGQLENELKQDAWVISAVNTQAIGQEEGPSMWRSIIHTAKPELRFLADAPEDPSLN